MPEFCFTKHVVKEVCEAITATDVLWACVTKYRLTLAYEIKDLYGSIKVESLHN